MNTNKAYRYGIVFVILMVLISIMTACQPTPEDLIVQNKADEDLQEAIAVSAAPQSEMPQNTEIPNQTVRVTDKAANDTGTISVNINADVILPTISDIPVAYIEPVKFTQDQADRIVNTFFGNSTLYDVVTTKADIEATILRMQEKLSDDEALLNSDLASASGSTDLEELRSLQNKRIEEQKKRWQNAPEERPLLKRFDVTSDKFIYAAVDIGKDYMGYFDYTDESIFRSIHCSAFGGEWGWSLRRLESHSSTQIDINANGEEYKNAKQMAIDMISDMGIDGVRLGEAYLSKDQTGLMTEGQEVWGVTSDREFNVFCFERIVGEGTLDYTFYRGNGGDEEYQKPLRYERIQVWVESDEIVQFNWESPIRIKEIINDNAVIQIDYEQAINLMNQHAFIKYADLWDGRLKDLKVNIDKVKFALVRIKERNTGNFIVVPAWKFYGDLTGRLTEEAINKGVHGTSNDYIPIFGQYRLPDSRNILTINALDGTVIDLSKGY